MPVSVSVNGTSYSIPKTSETGWGDNLKNWIVAISQSTLQKNGGTFTLTSELDFGATFGVKSAYFKSRAATVSSVGAIRLGVADLIGWRNNAGLDDLELGINASDQLTFNGFPVVSSTALTASRALQSDGTGLISPSSVTSTELGYLSGVTSGLQAQLNGKQASGNYITALTGHVAASGPGSAASTIQAGVIVDSMVNASAAIALSKLAATTISRALVSDGSGVISPSLVTSTELGYVSGVTSAIQTQFSGKLSLSTATTKGDLLAATGSAAITRLGVGSDGQFLKADSSQSTGLIWASANANLTVATKTTTYTATGSDDLILCDATSAGFTVTLPAATGNTGKVLRIKKTDSSANAVTISRAGSDTIDGATSRKIGAQSDDIIIVSDGSATWQVIKAEAIAARYFASSTTISGTDATIVWTTKDYDTHSAMSSGTFTVPVAGKYQIAACLQVAATYALGNATLMSIYKNGTQVTQSGQTAAGAQSSLYPIVSDTVSCAAGDTITIRALTSGTTPSIAASNVRNYVSIVRVG